MISKLASWQWILTHFKGLVPELLHKSWIFENTSTFSQLQAHIHAVALHLKIASKKSFIIITPISLVLNTSNMYKETKELLKLVFLSFAPFPPPLMKRWNESFSLYGEGGLLSSKIPSTAMNITQTPQEQRWRRANNKICRIKWRRKPTWRRKCLSLVYGRASAMRGPFVCS